MFEPHTIEIFRSGHPLDEVIASQSRVKTSNHEEAIPPTILVVDDERLVADTIGEILEGAGYAVTIAYDGANALQLASKLRPDYLLSDAADARNRSCYCDS